MAHIRGGLEARRGFARGRSVRIVVSAGDASSVGFVLHGRSGWRGLEWNGALWRVLAWRGGVGLLNGFDWHVKVVTERGTRFLASRLGLVGSVWKYALCGSGVGWGKTKARYGRGGDGWFGQRER